MKNYILLSLTLCLTFSCKEDTTKFSNLEALPIEQFQKLFSEATYVDYIFYDLPFSISQDDKPSISANLKYISSEKLGPIDKNCKPIGREFFHIDGAIAFEAEIYFQEGCYGYVFLQKEKPIYANKVSLSGMNFYQNITTQAEQIKNRALNGE